jgi:hypothetical protein
MRTARLFYRQSTELVPAQCRSPPNVMYDS